MEYTLITGATGVLGGAFADECLRRGENLYLTGRSARALEELKSHLLTVRPRANIEICACDLADERSREALFCHAEKFVFSRLINAAGADIQKAFHLYDQKKLAFQVRADFEGAAAMCLFALGHRAAELKIVNVSSLCGEYAMPYFALYAASKGALTSFSLALAEECRGTGVCVTAVLPGAIYTRPDVCEYIAAQGLWGRLAAKTPQYVVAGALAASDSGKTRVILGAANKLAHALSRLVPKRLMIKLNAAARRDVSKDAF